MEGKIRWAYDAMPRDCKRGLWARGIHPRDSSRRGKGPVDSARAVGMNVVRTDASMSNHLQAMSTSAWRPEMLELRCAAHQRRIRSESPVSDKSVLIHSIILDSHADIILPVSIGMGLYEASG